VDLSGPVVCSRTREGLTCAVFVGKFAPWRRHAGAVLLPSMELVICVTFKGFVLACDPGQFRPYKPRREELEAHNELSVT